MRKPVILRRSFRSSFREILELMLHRPSELVALIALGASFCPNIIVIITVAITVGKVVIQLVQQLHLRRDYILDMDLLPITQEMTGAPS